MFAVVWIGSAAAGGFFTLGVGYAPTGTHHIQATAGDESITLDIDGEAYVLDLAGGLALGGKTLRVELGVEARLEALHVDLDSLQAATEQETTLDVGDIGFSWAPRPAYGPTVGLATSAGPIGLGARGAYLMAPTGFIGTSTGWAAEGWLSIAGLSPYVRAQVLTHHYSEADVTVKAQSTSTTLGLRIRIDGAKKRRQAALDGLT